MVDPEPRRGSIPRPHGKVPVIEDMDDFTESINILCHGDTGSGKTVLWSKLPDMLVLAIEEGTVSAKRQGSTAKVVRIRTWPEFVATFEWLRDGGSMKVGGKTIKADDFKWVMLDSVTSIQTLLIRYVMEMVTKANPARDPHIPSQGDHFKFQLWLKEVVQDFNSLPHNVVWLSRSMVKDDPDGNEIIVPQIEGKDYGISAWVCGEMHLLCYLKKEAKGKDGMTRKLYTNEHPMYWCKDRYDVLPHIIANPDARKIVRLIEGSGSTPVASSVSTRKPTTAAKKKTARRK
jgi:hypothetical protein